MYPIFVVLSIALERAGAWLGLPAGLRRFETSAAYDRAKRAFFGVPFVLYPIVLVALSLAFSIVVDRAHAAEGKTTVAEGLPYDFLYLHDPRWHETYAHVATPLLANVCAQTLVLVAVFAYARARALSRLDLAVVGASAAVLLATALGRHLLESTDSYNYIVYARVGLPGAYGTAISVDDAALRRVAALTWGATLPPSPYGPLWQLYDGAIVGTSSVAEAMLRLRLVNVVALLGLFGGLWAARIPLASLLVLVLNPYVYAQFVTNAHNDLIPIAALALGAAFASRRAWAAIVATALAGLIKLPLLAVGFVTLGAIASLRTRALAVVGILVVDGAVSYALGGRPYLDALFAAGPVHVTSRAQIVVTIAGLVSIALALATRRKYWPGLLAIPALRSFEYSWYLIWLVPFSFGRRSMTLPIAIVFPVIGFLFADVYATPKSIALAVYGVLALGIAIALARTRESAA